MHARYIVQIDPQPDNYPGYLITSRDFPPLTSDGETWEEALRMARGALLAMITWMIEDDEIIPMPRNAPGVEIDLGSLVAMKIALNNLRVEQGISRGKLSELLGGSATQGYRTLSVVHHSRMDVMDRAFALLGHRLELSVEPMPQNTRVAAE